MNTSQKQKLWTVIVQLVFLISGSFLIGSVLGVKIGLAVFFISWAVLPQTK